MNRIQTYQNKKRLRLDNIDDYIEIEKDWRLELSCGQLDVETDKGERLIFTNLMAGHFPVRITKIFREDTKMDYVDVFYNQTT